MDIEAIFGRMAGAPMTQSGQYFQSGGRYRLRLKGGKVNAGFKGTFFIAEFEVLESDKAEDPVGSTRSYTVRLDNKQRDPFGDIKALIFPLVFGLEPSKVPPPDVDLELHTKAAQLTMILVDPAYAAKVGAPPGVLDGRTVRLETVAKPTAPTAVRPQGGTFTKHLWTPDTPANG